MILNYNPNLPPVFSPTGKFIYKTYSTSRNWNDFTMPENLLKNPEFPKTLIPFLMLNDKLIQKPRLKNKITLKRLLQHFKICKEAFRLRNIQFKKYNLGFWERYHIGLNNFYRWVPPENKDNTKTFLPFWEPYSLPSFSPLSLKAQIVFSWIYKHCSEYNHFRVRVSNAYIGKQLNYCSNVITDALKELKDHELISLTYYTKNPLANVHLKQKEIKTYRVIQLTDIMIQKRIQLRLPAVVPTIKQAVRRDCIPCFGVSQNIPSAAFCQVSNVAVFAKKFFFSHPPKNITDFKQTLIINCSSNYVYYKTPTKKVLNIIKRSIITKKTTPKPGQPNSNQINNIKNKKKNILILESSNYKKKSSKLKSNPQYRKNVMKNENGSSKLVENPVTQTQLKEVKAKNYKPSIPNDVLNVKDFLPSADSVLEEEIKHRRTQLKNKQKHAISLEDLDECISLYDYEKYVRKKNYSNTDALEEELEEAPSVFDYYPRDSYEINSSLNIEDLVKKKE